MLVQEVVAQISISMLFVQFYLVHNRDTWQCLIMSSLGGFAIISLCQLLCEEHYHSCYLLENFIHNLGYLTVLFGLLMCELNN